MHEWYELSLKQIAMMDLDSFLDLCASYLEEAIANDIRRQIDLDAQYYTRYFLKLPEEANNWLIL